jgi:hypothetical protein
MSEEQKRPVGAPTKLTEKLLENARAYVKECEDNHEEIVVRRGLDDKGEVRWEQTAPRLPNLNRLALVCEIHKGTLYRWRDGLDSDGQEIPDTREYAPLLKEFRNLCARIESLQELCLVEEGGAGRLNPAVATRIMATKHGYAERTETTSDVNFRDVSDTLKKLTEQLRDDEDGDDAAGDAELKPAEIPADGTPEPKT